MLDHTITIAPGLSWNIDEAPHGLASGVTGGGKSRFLLYLLLELYKRGQVRIVDPKRSDLFQVTKHILPERHVAVTPGQIGRLLRETHDEMLSRYEQMDAFGKAGVTYRDLGLQPLTIIFDEFSAHVADIEDDKKLLKEVKKYLRRIILLGRQAGCFIVIAMQKPSAEVLSTDIRDQLSMRVTLGQMDITGYTMVFGSQPGMRYEYRPAGSGYLYVPGQGYSIPQTFDAPWIDDVSTIEELLWKVKQRKDV